MTRDAVTDAAQRAGLAVVGVLERDAESRLASLVGESPEGLAARLTALGRAVGPPWRRAEKLAAAAAWIALAQHDQSTP